MGASVGQQAGWWGPGDGGGGEGGTGVRLGGRRSEVDSQWDGGVVEGLSRGMT